jgi:hypothetical protein
MRFNIYIYYLLTSSLFLLDSKSSNLDAGNNKGSNKNFNSQTIISSPITISNSAPTTLTTAILPITERAKRYNLVKYPSFYSHIAYHFYYLVIESSFSNGTDYSTHFTGREAVVSINLIKSLIIVFRY